jgi:hypothetical protein
VFDGGDDGAVSHQKHLEMKNCRQLAWHQVSCFQLNSAQSDGITCQTSTPHLMIMIGTPPTQIHATRLTKTALFLRPHCEAESGHEARTKFEISQMR